MAEEKEDSGSERGGGVAAAGPDPEIGSAGAAASLQTKAEQTLASKLSQVVDCILVNVEAKHLPSARLLVDLASRVEANEEVPEADYRSLAEVLWAAVQEMEKQGTGNRN